MGCERVWAGCGQGVGRMGCGKDGVRDGWGGKGWGGRRRPQQTSAQAYTYTLAWSGRGGGMGWMDGRGWMGWKGMDGDGWGWRGMVPLAESVRRHIQTGQVKEVEKLSGREGSKLKMLHSVMGDRIPDPIWIGA